MVRSNRVKEYIFRLGSITASSAGLFSTFSDYSVNGTIQSVQILDTSYSDTGSLILFESGTGNSGVGLSGRIIRLRAGSENQTFYPFVYADNNAAATGSPQTFAQNVINAPLRLVGSGLGNGTSGLGVVVKYI